MWTRAELKDRAKFAFKRNYWRSVLISLLLAFLIGGGSGAGSAGSALSSALGSDGSDITSDSYDDFYDDADDIWYGMNDVYDNTDHTALLFAGVIFVVIFMIVFVIIMTVTILLDAFIFNPLEVGCKRFYLRNLNEAALVGNAGYAFDNNYKNIAKTMFFRDLYTVLWSMLFIIPGIVKSYEYQMIPYLLADNPQMTKEEAFAESKRMMQGQKWNAFVLDLSFIGWDILSGMTMGILGIFYVQPYKDGTHAALYEALRYRTPYQPIQDPAPYQQNATMDQQTTEMPNRFENRNMDQPFEDRTDY